VLRRVRSTISALTRRVRYATNTSPDEPPEDCGNPAGNLHLTPPEATRCEPGRVRFASFALARTSRRRHVAGAGLNRNPEGGSTRQPSRFPFRRSSLHSALNSSSGARGTAPSVDEAEA
jgi:hypothetical protein